MPSPFPGMDPYLEAPDIWPDLHNDLAGQIRAALNDALPAPYYARLEMRPEVGIVAGNEPRRRITPDVAVARPPSPPASAAAAVLDAPRRQLSASRKVTVRCEPLRHAYVEVHDASRGHELITLIEIASPSNKRPGVDRRAYLRKQREVLDSSSNLIELDLLRAGDRLLSNLLLDDAVARLEPAPDYLVLVNRAWERTGDGSEYEIFPIALADALPCIPVPLRQGEEETPLDLQYAFQRAYDTGPYRRGAVDYNLAPEPPLVGEWALWAQERVRQWQGG